MLSAIEYSSNTHWFLFSTIISLCIGSFINVVIYRLPIMIEYNEGINNSIRLNLFLPHSFCPSCSMKIGVFDNIPLLSWILLRGRCRYCRQAISVQYLLVELIVMLTGITLAWYLGIGVDWLFLLAFIALLLVLAIIDVKYQLLPDCLTLPLLWIGLLWHCMTHPQFLPAAVTGAIAGYLMLWLLYWGFRLATGREGLGYGDFKLLAALGAWGGYEFLPLLLILASSGSLLWLLIRVLRGSSWSQLLPFGPGLSVAGAGIVVYQWVILPVGS